MLQQKTLLSQREYTSLEDMFPLVNSGIGNRHNKSGHFALNCSIDGVYADSKDEIRLLS
jgi:hypothetical protein